MNLAESFVEYLQTLTGSRFGQDIFIGEAPSSNNVQDAIWWIVTSGGTPVKNITGESTKTYQIEVFYRDRSYQSVYDNMHQLEEQLNCSGCVQLTGFETFDISATTFPIDNDLDSEDRKIGLLQATITTYKEC